MIIQYIIDILKTEDSIFINDLGLFEKKLIPAQMKGNILSPPQYKILFDPNGEGNGFSFILKYAEREQKRLTDADSEIKKWVSELKNGVQNNQSISVEGFGTFSLNTKSEISFESGFIQELNIEFEGLEPVQASPIETAVPDVSTEEEISGTSDTATPKEINTQEDTTEIEAKETILEEKQEEITTTDKIEKTEELKTERPSPTVESPAPDESPTNNLNESANANVPEEIDTQEEPIKIAAKNTTYEEKQEEITGSDKIEVETERPFTPLTENEELPQEITEKNEPATAPVMVDQDNTENIVTSEKKAVEESRTEAVKTNDKIEQSPSQSQITVEEIPEAPIAEEDTISEEDQEEEDTKEETPKKKRKTGWIVLGIILLLLIPISYFGYQHRVELELVYKEYSHKLFGKSSGKTQSTNEMVFKLPESELPGKSSVTLNIPYLPETSVPEKKTVPDENNIPETTSISEIEPEPDKASPRPEGATKTTEPKQTTHSTSFPRENFQKGKYYVIAGSFTNDNDASKHIIQNHYQRYNPVLLYQDGNSRVRVCIGIFDNSREAETLAASLEKGAWVLK